MPELHVQEPRDPATVAWLRAVVADQHTLHDVVGWMAAVGGGPTIVSIVDQDEFTNDVVVHESEGVFLVYDCT